ncbi:MAG: type II toxin-antitoxin system VapC family toxin [Acidobacteriaceae bacterium]|nr:type II toxin-antitoxin system VapC family toxin [Acidobacteriaceae bacterium]
MEHQYLLDTNIASFIIKKTSHALDFRSSKFPAGQLVVSAVTEAELRYGAARLPAEARLHELVEKFLARVTILPWDSDSAQQYGLLRAALEKIGQPMDDIDLMIAAHALALGLVLVTNDHAFSRIKKLKVEDWTKGPRP